MRSIFAGIAFLLLGSSASASTPNAAATPTPTVAPEPLQLDKILPTIVIRHNDGSDLTSPEIDAVMGLIKGAHDQCIKALAASGVATQAVLNGDAHLWPGNVVVAWGSCIDTAVRGFSDAPTMPADVFTLVIIPK